MSPGTVPDDEFVYLSHRSAERLVNMVFEFIVEALASGRGVELRNFGIFDVRVRKATTGRDMNGSGGRVQIPARAVVRFKAGKDLRQRVLKLTPK